jgi:hypothetical protein
VADNFFSPPGSAVADPDVAAASRAADMGLLVAAPVLHPSTSPAAIAADQAASVREASARLGTADPEVLSADVCLPAWVVERRLVSLGLLGRVRDQRVARGVRDRDGVARILRQIGRPATVIEVARAASISTNAARRILLAGHGFVRSFGRPMAHRSSDHKVTLWYAA